MIYGVRLSLAGHTLTWFPSINYKSLDRPRAVTRFELVPSASLNAFANRDRGLMIDRIDQTADFIDL